MPTPKQIGFIAAAVEEAAKSDLQRCHHGAVIVKGGKIVAKGHNRYNNHHISGALLNGERTIHAEVDALTNAVKCRINLKNADMYVVRFHANTDKISNSKPCADCEQFINICIKKYGFRNTFYTSIFTSMEDLIQKSDSIS